MLRDRTNTFSSNLNNSSILNSYISDYDDFKLIKQNSNKANDRFIPSYVNRNLFNIPENQNTDNNTNKDNKSNTNGDDDGRCKDEQSQFKMLLKKSVIENDEMAYNPLKKTTKKSLEKESLAKSQRKILSFHKPVKDDLNNHDIDIHSPNNKKYANAESYYSRKINTESVKIQDAPSLHDDFYFNLVDWSPTNLITIGQINHVYSLNFTSNKSFKLHSFNNGAMASSISSSNNGDKIAVGNTLGELEVFDFEKSTSIRKLPNIHHSRIGSLAWKDNIQASGSRDSTIFMTDIRSKKPFVNKLQGHKQEICGQKFNSFDDTLASGGNDNKVIVWDQRGGEIRRFSEHKAAIKALAWSPHQNGLLASGGGSNDKTIKLWNIKTGNKISSTDTGSQVCALEFSKSVDELVSTHGYSQNQIEIWKVPEMQNLATLTGHTSRVLYLDISPGGESIVTAAADETQRFWNIFPSMISSPEFIRKNNSFNCRLDLR